MKSPYNFTSDFNLHTFRLTLTKFLPNQELESPLCCHNLLTLPYLKIDITTWNHNTIHSFIHWPTFLLQLEIVYSLRFLYLLHNLPYIISLRTFEDHCTHSQIKYDNEINTLLKKHNLHKPPAHDYESSSHTPLIDKNRLTIIQHTTLIPILPYSSVYLEGHYLHINCKLKTNTFEDSSSKLLWSCKNPKNHFLPP